MWIKFLIVAPTVMVGLFCCVCMLWVTVFGLTAKQRAKVPPFVWMGAILGESVAMCILIAYAWKDLR